jgi:hypothetical protein
MQTNLRVEQEEERELNKGGAVTLALTKSLTSQQIFLLLAFLKLKLLFF